MNFAESQRNPGRHSTGLIIVIVMHVLLAYAIVSGLGKRVIEKVLVTETKLVEAPPPPPPPPKDLPPPPKALPPPPVYVPPPPVDVPPPPIAPSITATTVLPTAPPPTAPATPAPAPAPAPAVSHATAAIIKATDPSCRPEYPPAATRANATGTSRIMFTVDEHGKVTGADIISPSGPTREHRLLDKAAQSALAQCPITVGHDAAGSPVATKVEVDYVWKLE